MTRDKAGFDVLGRIRSEREKRKWTEYELAKNSEITQSTISTWYRKGLQPSVASIEKICAGLGISMSEFFNAPSTETSYLTKEEKDTLSLFRSLSPKQRKAAVNFLKSMINGD